MCRLISITLTTSVQALDEDQPGEKVEHRKVFEEDRDFNQGIVLVGVSVQTCQPALLCQS